MTWIPCSRCFNAPCTCSQTVWPDKWVQPTWPGHGWVGPTQFKFEPVQKLSDEDVDRIAQRVVDKVGERIAAARSRWAKRFRGRVKWMERLLGSCPVDDKPTPGGDA